MESQIAEIKKDLRIYYYRSFLFINFSPLFFLNLLFSTYYKKKKKKTKCQHTKTQKKHQLSASSSLQKVTQGNGECEGKKAIAL